MKIQVPADTPALPAGIPMLLTPEEVGRLHRVDSKTVTRWAKAGKVTSIMTVGGHRRFQSAQFADVIIATGWRP